MLQHWYQAEVLFKPDKLESWPRGKTSNFEMWVRNAGGELDRHPYYLRMRLGRTFEVNGRHWDGLDPVPTGAEVGGIAVGKTMGQIRPAFSVGRRSRLSIEPRRCGVAWPSTHATAAR